MEVCVGAFFLAKGPSLEISHWDISKFTLENALFRIRLPLSAESGQGALPLWKPHHLLKKVDENFTSRGRRCKF